MAVERTAHIDLIQEHDEDTRSLFLALDEPLAFKPGQFLSLLLPVGGDRIIRPYSIASDPEEPEYLEILYNLVPDGPGSHYLHERKLGDTIDFTGPWGTFVLDEPPGVETVLIAQNTCIAPLRSIVLARACDGPTGFRLLYGTTLGVYVDELATYSHVKMDVVPPDALVDEATRRLIDDPDADRRRRIFICGVGAMVYTLRDRLRAAGYERRAVQYEKW